MYKILWLDDDVTDLKGFVNDASMEGLTLINKETADEALEYLHGNLHSIDAIILDVMGKKADVEEGAKEGAIHFFQNKRSEESKVIPTVILTGQAGLVSDEEFEDRIQVQETEIPIFSKQDDNDSILETLISMIEARPYAKVRKHYASVLELVNKDSFKNSDYSILVEILDEASRGKLTQQLPFGAMRVILDGAIEAIFQEGFLNDHKEEELLRKGTIISQNCQRLLKGEALRHNRSGRGIRLKNGKSIPKLITSMMEQIYGLGSSQVHSSGDEEWDYDLEEAKAYSNEISLLRSTVQNLCVVLEYFQTNLLIPDTDFELESRGDEYTDIFTRQGNQFHSSWGDKFTPSFGCYQDLKVRFSKGQKFKVKVLFSNGNLITSRDINDYHAL